MQDSLTLPFNRENPIGCTCYFEYHCWESGKSADAHLWYRSHQQVYVIGYDENSDNYAPDCPETETFEKRCENGCQNMYSVRFSDGYVGTVFEDELMETEDYYCSENPPIVDKSLHFPNNSQ